MPVRSTVCHHLFSKIICYVLCVCVCVCPSFLSFVCLLRYAVPYTFGYLFALGVYAHGETAGDGFHAQYVALLRDTGRMTAEELVQVREKFAHRLPVKRCRLICQDRLGTGVRTPHHLMFKTYLFGWRFSAFHLAGASGCLD